MQPEFKSQLGQIQMAIFNHDGRRSVSVQRRYLAGEEWKSSSYLFPEDVPVAIRLLAEAESFLLSLRNGSQVSEATSDSAARGANPESSE